VKKLIVGVKSRENYEKILGLLKLFDEDPAKGLVRKEGIARRTTRFCIGGPRKVYVNGGHIIADEIAIDRDSVVLMRNFTHQGEWGLEAITGFKVSIHTIHREAELAKLSGGRLVEQQP
jgi:hypothetical protein